MIISRFSVEFLFWNWHRYYIVFETCSYSCIDENVIQALEQQWKTEKKDENVNLKWWLDYGWQIKANFTDECVDLT